MSDVPGWECINHYPGPPVPCQCGVFYGGTYCQPVRFWQFAITAEQTAAEWLWINSVEWLETDVFTKVFLPMEKPGIRSRA